MSDDVIDRIREAIGADEDEPIVVKTPTFERQDGEEPTDPPLTEEAWEDLRDLSAEELTELGFQNWDGDLYLLPSEWFPHIPEGEEFTSILGEKVEFDSNDTDNDKRYGALSFGFVVGMDPNEYREREQSDELELATEEMEVIDAEDA